VKTREEKNAYHAAYNLARYYRRRAEAIRILGDKCQGCGATDKLELDHINRETKRSEVSKLLTWSWTKILEELQHCQVLCKRCHEEKTKRELGVPHGGGVSGKKNCKCEPCRERKNEYMRNRKARLNSSNGRVPFL